MMTTMNTKKTAKTARKTTVFSFAQRWLEDDSMAGGMPKGEASYIDRLGMSHKDTGRFYRAIAELYRLNRKYGAED